MKENKGLSDRELIVKYEAGAINLSKVLQKATFKELQIDKKQNRIDRTKDK